VRILQPAHFMSPPKTLGEVPQNQRGLLLRARETFQAGCAYEPPQQGIDTSGDQLKRLHADQAAMGGGTPLAAQKRAWGRRGV
jgi:hypothetical protein